LGLTVTFRCFQLLPFQIHVSFRVIALASEPPNRTPSPFRGAIVEASRALGPLTFCFVQLEPFQSQVSPKTVA
jgi:hypothetical protein